MNGLETGDIIFVFGQSFFSKLIGHLTFGKVSHVALVVSNRLYETEGGWNGHGRSGFSDLSKYDNGRVEFWRMRGLTDQQKKNITVVTEARSGTPYSYWDCIVNGAFFFLHPKIKGWLAARLGTRFFTKCDEEILTSLYAATEDERFSEPESHTPKTFYEMVKADRDFEPVLTV